MKYMIIKISYPNRFQEEESCWVVCEKDFTTVAEAIGEIKKKYHPERYIAIPYYDIDRENVVL